MDLQFAPLLRQMGLEAMTQMFDPHFDFLGPFSLRHAWTTLLNFFLPHCWLWLLAMTLETCSRPSLTFSPLRNLLGLFQYKAPAQYRCLGCTAIIRIASIDIAFYNIVVDFVIAFTGITVDVSSDFLGLWCPVDCYLLRIPNTEQLFVLLYFVRLQTQQRDLFGVIS